MMTMTKVSSQTNCYTYGHGHLKILVHIRRLASSPAKLYMTIIMMRRTLAKRQELPRLPVA